MSKPTAKPEPAKPMDIDTLTAAREIFAMGLGVLRECSGDVLYWEKLAPGVNGALANLIEAEKQARNG